VAFFWRVGFYPANQSNLKSLQKALIGWKKAGPPNKHFFKQVKGFENWIHLF